MRWEHLTSPDFAKAVDTCSGVGILPMGVLEPHGAHLPLGQDMLQAHAVACRAAGQEPAIVMPVFPWTINHEAAHLTGAVVLSRDLVMSTLSELCEEMSRNGLKKIILFSGHGGNRFIVDLFIQTFLTKRRDYIVYRVNVPFISDRANALMETDDLGHACEAETSLALFLHGDLVKMDAVPDDPSRNLGRNKPLADAGVYSPVDWYAMWPNMYVGDASKAAPDKGRVVFDDLVAGLAKAIRAVKDDTATQTLVEEFTRAQSDPHPPFHEDY